MEDGGTLFGRDAVMDWAFSEGISELWRIQEEFSGEFSPELDIAYRIFSIPQLRSAFGLLLLSRATPGDISQLFRQKFGMSVSDDVIDVYERVFWDWRSLSNSDWRQFLQVLPRKEERNDLALGLRSPSIEEVRDHLELETEIDPKTIVSQIATRSYLKWKQAMAMPDPMQSNVEYWQNAALKAANDWDRIKRANADDDDVLKSGGFEGLFSVTATVSSHPTVADLQGEVSETQSKVAE